MNDFERFHQVVLDFWYALVKDLHLIAMVAALATALQWATNKLSRLP